MPYQNKKGEIHYDAPKHRDEPDKYLQKIVVAVVVGLERGVNVQTIAEYADKQIRYAEAASVCKWMVQEGIMQVSRRRPESSSKNRHAFYSFTLEGTEYAFNLLKG